MNPGARHLRQRAAPLALVSLLTACSGGSGPAAPPAPQPSSVALVRVSQPSTFPAGCDGVAPSGTLYTDTVAEPYLAVNPTSPANLIGAWQQNRWSDGGAQGLMLAASFDAGATWTLSRAAFSRCTGGNAGNRGDYARASDIWLAFSPDGAAYALSLSFSGLVLAAGSSSAMLVARSQDGGMSWGAPTALIQDGAQSFNDKGSITSDPLDARFVYAVWDRITSAQNGPSWLAVTSDAGASWQAARSIYDPGVRNQTLGNQIAVLPGGVVVDVFTEIDVSATGAMSASLRAIQSADHGGTWSAPVKIADLLAVGTRDPQTGAAVRDGSNLASVAVAAGGVIYVVWQDSRFSGGQHDGIALARSADGGGTWSPPAQVNALPAAAAFTPTVHVRADGVVAVTYYDLRNDTSDPATLLTDYWLVTSADAVSWRESHLSGPFDLDLAPDSRGLFLGDYEALASSGSELLPFFVQSSAGAQQTHTDLFLAFAPASLALATRAVTAEHQATAAVAAPFTVTPEWRRRVQQRIMLTLAQRFGDSRHFRQAETP